MCLCRFRQQIGRQAAIGLVGLTVQTNSQIGTSKIPVQTRFGGSNCGLDERFQCMKVRVFSSPTYVCCTHWEEFFAEIKQ
jgi:hypothetical protein